MSSQTDERTDSIEHLDFEPLCDCGCHDDRQPPPADYLLRVRGSWEEFLRCTRCTRNAEAFYRFLGSTLQVIPLRGRL